MFSKVMRLAKDAEMATTQNGKAMLKFTAAYDVGYGEHKNTVWCNCVKWGDKNAGLLPYMKKGQQVEVMADEIQPEAYTAKDGELKAVLKVNVFKIELVGSSGQQANQQPAQQRQQAPQQPQAPQSGYDFSDDIPF